MTTELMSWRSLLDLGWLLFLLLVLYYFWCARRVTLQTRTWSKTHGRVTQCAWVTYDHSLWPKIEYIYQVGDRDFTGEHFFIDTVHNDPSSVFARKLAYQVVSAYKKNEDIDVYFDPDNPENAVLDRTVPRKLNLILSFIVGLIVLHLVITISRFFG